MNAVDDIFYILLSTCCGSTSRLQRCYLHLCPQSPPSRTSADVLAGLRRHFCEDLCNEIDVRERRQVVASR